MADKRNSILWETIKDLPDLKAYGLVCYLFGFEESCEHFHDGVEKWLEISPPDVTRTEV